MQYVLSWIPVIALVIASVLVADAARFRARSRFCGHWAASGAFALLVTAYIALSMDLLAFRSLAQALAVGLGWALATVLVDLGVAGTVMRGDWAGVLTAYDPRAGHFWSAALLWIAIAPAALYLLLG